MGTGDLDMRKGVERLHRLRAVAFVTLLAARLKPSFNQRGRGFHACELGR
jgi:hypothetical protein